MSYKFTNNWFSSSEIKQNMKIITSNIDIKNKINILEIGAYEGASTTYFADNLLDHEESKLVSVDPFLLEDSTTPMKSNTEELFLYNISQSKNSKKIMKYKLLSKDFYRINQDKYDFIYIDGSHLIEDVKLDFINCLEITKPNGIIWMDDYGAEHLGLTKCIKELYETYKERLEIIFLGKWQIGFRVLVK
jgi:predicted O-methyltransferase YrrM